VPWRRKPQPVAKADGYVFPGVVYWVRIFKKLPDYAGVFVI